ncbi:putative Ig domain-containing protein [Marmoricola sp. OAE513]|uniref:putative Ig domain-containing protein n=1 Tax=Marmoricola sp. OAE513 TaxID=2817894 RepID=UPI001AE3C1F7
MTTSPRTRLWSTLATAAVLLVALTGLAAPAQAATARSLTTKASPALEYGGKQVTFSGTLSKSPKGSTVKIKLKSGTSYVTAAKTKTTTSSGKYSVKVTLPTTPASYTYRAAAPKKGKLATAYSKTITVKVLRKTTATLTANPTIVASGGTATLSGTVSPFVSGTKVAVQRLSGTSWVLVGNATLSGSGGYSVGVNPTTTTSYRVQVPLTGLNAGTVSPTRAVQVSLANAPTITTTSLPEGDKNLPYSATLTKTGGDGTWSVAGGTLKPGLTLNATTGAITGTPEGSGTNNVIFKFTETGSGLSATKNLSMTFSPLPTISTNSLPDATRGAPYTAELAKTGKAGTWSLETPVTGLTINPTTGVISGTTNVALGTYGVYPTFTETAGGRKVLKALALKVIGTPLAITTDPTLPDAHRLAPYSVTFTKVGGPGTWSANQIPDGFSLDPATGTLTGTPTVAGLNAVYVTFSETNGGSVTKGFSLKVVQPKITTTSIPDAVTGQAYSFQFAKTGLDGTWEITSSGFPPEGVTLSSSGLLAGTPTESGDWGITVTFTETSTGASSSNIFIFHSAAPGSPTITTTSLPNGTVGSAYSATLAATPAGGTWSITQGSLPVGLSLNPTTGAITGTPSVPENARFQVTYTNGGTKNTKLLGLLVPNPTPPAG